MTGQEVVGAEPLSRAEWGHVKDTEGEHSGLGHGTIRSGRLRTHRTTTGPPNNPLPLNEQGSGSCGDPSPTRVTVRREMTDPEVAITGCFQGHLSSDEFQFCPHCFAAHNRYGFDPLKGDRTKIFFLQRFETWTDRGHRDPHLRKGVTSVVLHAVGPIHRTANPGER